MRLSIYRANGSNAYGERVYTRDYLRCSQQTIRSCGRPRVSCKTARWSAPFLYILIPASNSVGYPLLSRERAIPRLKRTALMALRGSRQECCVQRSNNLRRVEQKFERAAGLRARVNSTAGARDKLFRAGNPRVSDRRRSIHAGKERA